MSFRPLNWLQHYSPMHTWNAVKQITSRTVVFLLSKCLLSFLIVDIIQQPNVGCPKSYNKIDVQNLVFKLELLQSAQGSSGLEEQQMKWCIYQPIMATLQDYGGGIMVGGCFSWSDLDPAMFCVSNMKSTDYLNTSNDQVFQDDNAMIHQAQSVWGWFREHHFYPWIGHHKIQILIPLKTFGIC